MSHRPAVLFLTSELPYPPHQGMAIRVYNLVAHLKERYRLHLLSLTSSPDADQNATALRAVCERVAYWPAPTRTRGQRVRDLLTSSVPDMALRAYSRQFESAFRDALEADHYDVVHVESIEMAPYALRLIREHPQSRPRFVFDDLNAEYTLQQKAFETDLRKPLSWVGAAYSFVQWKRLARYEREVCRTLDRVVAVSDWDREALLRLAPDADVRVVPNGIDVAQYVAYAPTQGQAPAPALVFTGKMDFRPNVDAVLWFCEKILPVVRAQVPEVRFTIVGQHPSPAVQRLDNLPGVTVTGFVPDVRPYVASADVYVVPMRMGGGTRLKVLEAMVMGKAIVSTGLGCEGYGITDGREAVLVETVGDFAQKVVALLRDPARRAELGMRAREFAAQRYDWSRIAPLLETAYGV